MTGAKPKACDTLEVRSFRPADQARWDAYVDRHAQGTLFHRTGWKRAVESSFPYEAHYLLAESDGSVRGLLPLFRVKNPMVPGFLLSVPMGVYGGVLADDEVAARELLRHASELGRSTEAAYLEYRHVHSVALERLRPGGAYATFVRDLPRDPSECLPRLPRKARAAARKAIRDFALSHNVGREGLGTFFDLFARNKRHLGSPVYPKPFFRELMREFPDSDLLFVRHGGREIAAVLSFYYKGTVIPYYSGADQRREHMQINNFMYLKLMEEGARRGFERFDFGRSREGSGSYRFKRHQGFEPTPLHYQYELVQARDLPNLSPDNPRFNLVRETWKRMPLFLVKWLGPRLIRYFP